jgi:hypothetical protein
MHPYVVMAGRRPHKASHDARGLNSRWETQPNSFCRTAVPQVGEGKEDSGVGAEALVQPERFHLTKRFVSPPKGGFREK